MGPASLPVVFHLVWLVPLMRRVVRTWPWAVARRLG